MIVQTSFLSIFLNSKFLIRIISRCVLCSCGFRGIHIPHKVRHLVSSTFNRTEPIIWMLTSVFGFLVIFFLLFFKMYYFQFLQFVSFLLNSVKVMNLACFDGRPLSSLWLCCMYRWRNIVICISFLLKDTCVDMLLQCCKGF